MNFVKLREKLVLVAEYPKNDPELTVGYGHTNSGLKEGDKITKKQAD